MERRTSIRPDRTFSSPLIVYKWSVDQALEYAYKVLELLLNNPVINRVFVEDLDKMNLETLIKIKQKEFEEMDKTINGDSDKKTELEGMIGFLSAMDSGVIKKFERGVSEPDLCIVIGGDGTTLWTNNLFGNGKKPPFLNFNLGSLGYMAIYSCKMIEEVLEELYSQNKKMSFEKRATVQCKIYSLEEQSGGTTSNGNESEIKVNANVNGLSSSNSHEYNHSLSSCCGNNDNFKAPTGKIIFEGNALNDVILEKPSHTNCINLKVYLNDDPLTVVKSDGIILSTSTGSTAYNLSAGGAVIHYDVDSLILNAICPHSLSFRAIALPRDIKIKIVPCANSFNKVIVNLDCIDKITLKENQYIEVALSDNYANFIVLEKFVKNRVNLWKEKIVNQLGWNNAFKNVD